MAVPPRSKTLSSLVEHASIFDPCERGLVLALYIYFLSRMLPGLRQLVLIQTVYPEFIRAAIEVNAQVALVILSETLVVLLIMIRRRGGHLSAHPFDWALSFAAVSLPLFTIPGAAGALVPGYITTAMMITGLIFQIAAKISIWRSFGVVPANHGVRTGGVYRLVRHPMYAGYILTHVGFLLGYPLLQNALLYLAAFALHILRIMREEAFLKNDPAYRAYAGRVRCRLLPGLF